VAVKAQALADFVAEFNGHPQDMEPPHLQTLMAQSPASTPKWTIFTDGASNKGGSGAWVVLRSPDNDMIERAVAFGFKASSNEAEYEALIIGLQRAHLCGAQNLEVNCDSQLVVE